MKLNLFPIILTQKGILFSTSGYQKGALDFAKSKSIAAITIYSDRYEYETRSLINHKPRNNKTEYVFSKYSSYEDEILCEIINNREAEIGKL